MAPQMLMLVRGTVYIRVAQSHSKGKTNEESSDASLEGRGRTGPDRVRSTPDHDCLGGGGFDGYHRGRALGRVQQRYYEPYQCGVLIPPHGGSSAGRTKSPHLKAELCMRAGLVRGGLCRGERRNEKAGAPFDAGREWRGPDGNRFAAARSGLRLGFCN